MIGMDATNKNAKANNLLFISVALNPCRAQLLAYRRLVGGISNEKSGAIHYVSIFLCEGLDFPVE